MNIIEKIDSNFAVSKTPHNEGMKYYNVLCGKFGIYGVFYKDGCFRRLPADIAKSVSDGVYALHTSTSGGRVRFITDSPYVAIHAVIRDVYKISQFPFSGSACFDLYSSEDSMPEKYVSTFMCPFNIKNSYDSTIGLGERKLREITINMPLYSGVRELYIGLEENSVLTVDKGYKDKKPFIYYGSSITQGGCASHPGNSYPARIGRHFGIDYKNLGFAGRALAEDEIADYIKDLPMSLFIYDYDYNSPSPAHLRCTHEKMFRKIRQANPALPVIILSRPNYNMYEERLKRLEIVKKTWLDAVNSGDKNVYFIDGHDLMSICKEDGTAENCHPNDLGFYSMAENLIKLIETIIK